MCLVLRRWSLRCVWHVSSLKSLARACADGCYVLLEVTLRAHCSAAMSFLLVCTHRRCCVVGAVSLLLLRCMICLRYCASSAALDLLVSRSGYTITYYVCAEGWGAACVYRAINDSITNPGVNMAQCPMAMHAGPPSPAFMLSERAVTTCLLKGMLATAQSPSEHCYPTICCTFAQMDS